jgi:NhaP-type Na+/H+ or K+/H+ antiporter
VLVIFFTAIAYLPYLLVFVGIQVALLMGTNRRRMFPLTSFKLAWRAVIGVLIGCVLGLGVGFLVMFGPSYLSGDFIGLPWFTMLPALGIGMVVAFLASHAISRMLVLSAKPRHLYRPAV